MLKDKRYALFSTLLLLVISAFMMLRQLTSPGYFSVQPYDIISYSSMAAQFTGALHEGLTYPRWLPLNFWGYGSPTFILYSPFAFYLVAMFELVTGSLLFSMNLVKFISLFLAALGMFFLVKEFYPTKLALFTAIFYLLLPFHIFQLYLVESFASVVSIIWFAPILLFIHKYTKHNQCRYLACAGASYGGLILTYLLHAYMFAFILSAFVVCLSIYDKKSSYLLIIPVILIIGALLSAAHLLPFLLEKNLLNTDALVTLGGLGTYHFSQGFILPDLSIKDSPNRFWPVYRKSYVLHVIIFSCVILFSLLQIWKINTVHAMKRANAVNIFFLLTSISSIFFLFGISAFLWDGIPFFKFIHLPKRWLNITSFAVAFLSAPIFWWLKTRDLSKVFSYVFIISLFSLWLLLDYRYISLANIVPETDLIPAKGINLVIEHLPAGVRIDKVDHDEIHGNRAELISGIGKNKVASWKSAERVIETKAEKPMTVRVRTFNFPGWTAYLDGVRTAIREENDTKAILVDVPPGNHSLKLVFEDTPVRFYGKLISIVSLLSFLAFMLMDIIRSRKAAIHG